MLKILIDFSNGVKVVQPASASHNYSTTPIIFILALLNFLQSTIPIDCSRSILSMHGLSVSKNGFNSYVHIKMSSVLNSMKAYVMKGWREQCWAPDYSTSYLFRKSTPNDLALLRTNASNCKCNLYRGFIEGMWER